MNVLKKYKVHANFIILAYDYLYPMTKPS